MLSNLRFKINNGFKNSSLLRKFKFLHRTKSKKRFNVLLIGFIYV